MRHRIIECLGVAVEVTSRIEEIDALVESVLRTYGEANRPSDVSYELDLGRYPAIRRDGQVIGLRDVPLDLVPALEIDLYRTVLSRSTGLQLHAGAIVGAGGVTMIFAGRSGAGKSTLVRALLAREFGYMSEECVALRPDGTCIGLCRPLHVEDDRIALPTGFTCDDYPIRTREHEVTRMRLFHPPPALLWHGPGRVAAVLQIDHAPEAQGRIERLSGGEALAALWPLTFRSDQGAVEQAAQALERVARFRLCTVQPEDAVARALELAGDLGVEPL